MQSLESRVSVIESRDSSLDVSVPNSLLNDSQPAHGGGASYLYQRQTLPRTRFSVSQGNSLQNTPVKPRKSLSVPSTPNGYSSQNCTNFLKNDVRSGCQPSIAATSNSTNINILARAKHDALTLYSDSFVVPPASCGTGVSHATVMSTKKDSYLSLRPNNRCTSNLYCKSHNSSRSTVPVSNSNSNASIGQLQTHPRIVQEMELSEVDELLQEMEATELELSKRINNTSGYQYHKELLHPILSTQTVDNASSPEKETQHNLSAHRKLDFQLWENKDTQLTDALSAFSQKKTNNAFPDISLPYNDSFHLNETDKIISEFKTWGGNFQQPVIKPNGYTIENIKNINHPFNVSATIDNIKPRESVPEPNVLMTDETNTSGAYTQSKSSIINTDPVSHINESAKLSGMMTSKTVQRNNTELLDLYKISQHNENLHNKEKSDFGKSIVHVGTNTDLHLRYLIFIKFLTHINFFYIYSKILPL